MVQEESPAKTLAIDSVNAVSLAARNNYRYLFRSFILVPVGIIFVLLALYGVHRTISLTPVNFPASVICMILLFLVLIFLDITIGSRRTAVFSRIIDVPLGFSLRWINTFFTPSFVLLPLSPAVGGAEVGKIAAVFILGFVVMMAVTAYMVLFLQKIFGTSKRAIFERAEELPPAASDFRDHRHPSSADSAQDLTGAIELDELYHSRNVLGVDDSAHHSEQRTLKLDLPEPVASTFRRHDHRIDIPLSLSQQEAMMNREVDSDLASMDDGSSTNSLNPIATRASRISRSQSNDLARTNTFNTIRRVLTGHSMANSARGSHSGTGTTNNTEDDRKSNYDGLPGSSDNAAHGSNGVMVQSTPSQEGSAHTRSLLTTPSQRAELFAATITRYLDTLLYTTIFFCVGLPVYFATGYTLIAHSTFTILMLFLGLRLPAKVRRFIHPIFTCSGFTILGIYVMSIAYHRDLNWGLYAYSTGRTYLNLFGVGEYKSVLPGAGDLLKTMLDVSIVALALPMYRYRGDLKKHFIIIIIPNVVIGLVTFFAYPPLCYAIGISAQRSISFIGRSVTLALALPVVQSLGGSQSLVAVTAILSGIIGVLIGSYILAGLKIREDDYLTRGITLGINSSAVATAHLLTIDPRASALSSLSFVLFGTTLIILSAITPIVHVMRHMVGLS
ncbi:LrgB-like family-domain-containing protein [Lipomyces chichibuensis]|uniref:LrgB-like family-domain-containing protein n=1 Tax=Lipomyces chichibuensis TaxID=1546026 RepID=UPI003343DB62